jgi:hypothetical protein
MSQTRFEQSTSSLRVMSVTASPTHSIMDHLFHQSLLTAEVATQLDTTAHPANHSLNERLRGERKNQLPVTN